MTTKYAEVTPPGFELIHEPRQDRKGGGVGLIYPTPAKAKKCDLGKYASFEYISANLNLRSKVINFTTIYRPPDSSIQTFLNEFYAIIEHITISYDKFIISGDFNLQ